VPATSIDTFFACSLIVSVALIAVAFTAGNLQTQLSGMQDSNQESYLHAIAEHIVLSQGDAVDWGSTGEVPAGFGLADSESSQIYACDIDKITRLNSQNTFALNYLEISNAARLSNLAFSASVSQMLTINVELSGNQSVGDQTEYTFRIAVSQDSGPVSAGLSCYFLATDFLISVTNETSSSGVGYAAAEIPNSASGPALLVVFARATFDERATAYEVHQFAHLSEESLPNQTFLELSPLNYTLNLNSHYPETAVAKAYTFTYGYQLNLTSMLNATVLIPEFLDSSPIVLAVQGTNTSALFSEWVSYPQVPLQAGSDFADSSANAFIYTVTIKNALYRLTLRLGDVTK